MTSLAHSPCTETDLLVERLATSSGDEATLRNRLAELHMASARRVALRYRGRGIEDDDLVQVAYTALVAAARRFDPHRGHEFVSYALPTVEGSIKRHFRDHGWSIRPPRRVQEAHQHVGTAREELTQRLGRSPTVDEVARHTGMHAELVIEALAARDAYSPASLDVPVGEDGLAGESLGDRLGFDDPAMQVADARLLLFPLVRRLSARDRWILAARFVEQRSQQDIADELGTSQMQVSRLLSRILRDLRAMMEGRGGPDRPAVTTAARPLRRGSGPAASIPSPRAASPASQGGAVLNNNDYDRQVEQVVAATRLIGAYIAESLADMDPPITMPQWRVLVLAAEGHANISAVAADLHVHMSNATRMCDRLVRGGLLERRRSEQDKRHILLTLTPAGQGLFDSAMDHRRRRVRETMDNMSSEERAAFAASAQSFVRAGARLPMPDD